MIGPRKTSWMRGLAMGAGVVAALAVIWFAGSLLSLGGVQPLEGPVARWTAMAAVVVLALALSGWRSVRSRQNNRRLLEGMVDPAGERSVPGAQEVKALGERFEQAAALLKQRVGARRAWWHGALGGQRYVYELPWYIIIGAPGAGKTTALAKSGLEFPLEAQLGKKMVRGVGGTRNCDWWFTTDAVLIDTAGRYTTQDSDRPADQAAWQGFLDLLARYRPGRPINGVLLTLSVSDLLNPDADKQLAHAHALRERVNELHARFGIRLPIYVLITKTDLLAGFIEFFQDFDKEERAQIWGATFPFDSPDAVDDPVVRMPGELAALESRLNECLIDRLHAESDRNRRAAIYAFPQQWRVLHERLLEMLPQIFAVGAAGDVRPLFRGLYFTSATQEGTPMDRAIGGLARALGLSSRVAPALRSTAKTFFVTRLLSDVVFREAGLAGTNVRWQRRRVLLGWALSAATVCLAVAAVLLSWRAYEDEAARVTAAAAQAAALAREVDVAKRTEPTDLAGLLPAMGSLQALASTPGVSSKRWRSWFEGSWGEGEMVRSVAGDAYDRMLRDSFLPRIAARLEQRLRSGSRDHLERLYEDLKAYQMLFSGKNFDSRALGSFLRADWDVTLPPTTTAADRAALRQHLDRLLATGEVGAPSQAEPATVATARSLISTVPLSQRVYGRLKQLELGPDAAPFSVESAAGPGTRRLFVRASGEPLSLGVPGLYSRAVYGPPFRQHTQEVLRQLATEQSWVLGTSGATVMEPAVQAKLVNEVEGLYVADYIGHWDAFVNDLRLAPTTSLSASAEAAQLLGHPNSPLQTVLRGVVREVSVARTVSPVQGGAAPADQEPLIDPRFEPLREYVLGQPSPLDGTLTVLGRLGTHLGALSDAIARKVPPPASDVIHELALAAPRAPEPVRDMLAQLAQLSAGQAFAALREPLGRELAEEVGAPCSRVATGRYPLVRTGSGEMSREDFARTFSAGGALDGFFQRNLAPYVDTSTRPWSYRGADGLRGETSESLQAFERAQAIRSSFFRDGGRVLGTTLEFRLLELDPGVKQFVLEVDGQVLRFGRDQRTPATLLWPTANATGQVRLQLATSSEAAAGPGFVFDGPWALLHLLDRVRTEPGASPDRVQLLFDVEGRKTRLEVRSTAPVNPLLRQDVEKFECPKRL